MLKLFTNCDVYAPKHLGVCDILVEGEKIAAVAADLSAWKAVPEIEIIDMGGAMVCPGLIDIHVHVTGGGGEQGPASRTPELQITDLTLNGVTSCVGLLGTDGFSRTLENLLFKLRELDDYGLSTWMLTGNYRYPSKTFTGDVQRDMALVDKIIGCKIAVADHRDSAVTPQELARLGTEVRVGSMITGKAGIVTMHMGSSEKYMDTIFRALELNDIPASHYLPTHCCRSPRLIEDAAKINKMGGFCDFTADIVEDGPGTAAAVMYALECGADAGRVTMSSDAGGSQPSFDEAGNCIGVETTTSKTLLFELRRFVDTHHLDMETALAFFTKNPAAVIGQTGVKGELAAGCDADILSLSRDEGGRFAVTDVWAKGKPMVRSGKALVVNKFGKW